MAKCRLRCLGRPILEVDGVPIKLEMRKSLALLVYLRMANQDISRETLSTLFWPEHNQQHALANLRRVLSSLNKSLLYEFLKADREKVGLKDPADIWLDIREFESLITTVKNQPDAGGSSCPDHLPLLKDAEQLYRGDFLEGFNLGDCSEFTEWQTTQRESLRRNFLWVLQRTAEVCQARSGWEQAISYARRWVALDPFHEPAHRLVMELYQQTGQRSAGLKQYDELARTLQDEFGQEPEEETKDLFQRILIGAAANGAERPVRAPKDSPVPQYSEPLLKTKLYIPASRGEKIIRQHILHELEQIEKVSLVVVSAPAGFGKTSLLTQWASQSAWPVAWYSLDRGDNEVARFLFYLSAALDSIQSGISVQAQSLLPTSQSIPYRMVLTYLIHDLGNLDTPSVLVLDDYQFITSSIIHDAVNFLLEYLPPNLHLIIATRADPPLGLSRLRLQNRLLEIRAQDLRFTSKESFEFLNKVMKLPLTEAEIALLDQRIEGWVVGYQMAAIALQSRPFLTDREEISRFIQTFRGSHRYILDYLTEEVLNHQPNVIQDFLIKTSILSRLCSPLCDAILGRWSDDQEEQFPFFISTVTSSETPSSQLIFGSSEQIGSTQMILEYLERTNLFITSLDDERCWYRYHHLFADLLAARLKQIIGEQGTAHLHQRASRWYQKNGFMEEAIHHAFAAQDYYNMANLIEAIAETTWANGQFMKLMGWIRALPENFAQSRIWLCIWFAWCLTQTGPLEEVGSWIEFAEQALENQFSTTSSDLPVNQQTLRDEINTIKVVKCSLDQDYVQALEYALPVLEHPLTSNRPSALMARCNLLHGCSSAYYLLGEFSKADQVCQETMRLSKEADYFLRYIHAVNKKSHIFWALGQLHQSLQFINEALEFCQQRGKQDYFPLSALYCRLSDLYYEWNDMETAQHMVAESIRINGTFEIPAAYIVWSLNVQGHLLIAQGDLDRAKNALEKAAALMRRSSCWPQLHWENDYYFVKLWLARGDFVHANRWLNEYRSPVSEATSFAQERHHIARARIYIAQEQPFEAVDILNRLAKSAQAAGRNGSLIEIRVLEALARVGRGERKEGLAALEEALLLGEPEGYRRVFLDEGEPMRGLVQDIQDRIHPPDCKNQQSIRLAAYVDNLLAAFKNQQ